MVALLACPLRLPRLRLTPASPLDAPGFSLRADLLHLAPCRVSRSPSQPHAALSGSDGLRLADAIGRTPVEAVARLWLQLARDPAVRPSFSPHSCP